MKYIQADKKQRTMVEVAWCDIDMRYSNQKLRFPNDAKATSEG